MSSISRDKLISWQTFHRGIDGRKVMHDGSLAETKWIYHMLPWPYAKAIFDNRRLRLSPVESWTDPYERWWCDILFDRTSKLSGLKAYGLCWTTGVYDEPRWRMAAFRRSAPIVRIRCRVDAILSAGRGLTSGRPGAMFLGSVRYKGEKWLMELAGSVVAGGRKDVTRTAAAMLLHKRNAFRFEHEVRLLWLDREENPGGLLVEIVPSAVINQVMTSPYATPAEHQSIKTFLDQHGVESKISAVLRPPAHP